MVWDFCEISVVADSATGGYEGALDWVAAALLEAWPGSVAGQVQSADAAEHPLPDETATVWFTDPPYYSRCPTPISRTFSLYGSSVRCLHMPS